MRILIVEDDPVSSLLLEKIIEGLGHEVVKASNGKEALDIFTTDPFSLVLSDWMMPEIDGVELCKTLKEFCSSVDHYCYFIMVTARGQHSDMVEALSAGTDDFITKPVQKENLFMRLKVAERIVEEHTVGGLCEGEVFAHIKGEHEEIIGIADRIEEMISAVGTLEGIDRLKDIISTHHEELYSATHIDKENLYVDSFLDSMIEEGDSWIGELSASSFMKIQKEHDKINFLIDQMKKIIPHYRNQICLLLEDIGKPRLPENLDDLKIEEMLDSTIGQLQGGKKRMQETRHEVEKILEEYVLSVREHVTMEEMKFFPFTRKYIKPENEGVLLDSFKKLEAEKVK